MGFVGQHVHYDAAGVAELPISSVRVVAARGKVANRLLDILRRQLGQPFLWRQVVPGVNFNAVCSLGESEEEGSLPHFLLLHQAVGHHGRKLANDHQAEAAPDLEAMFAHISSMRVRSRAK